MHSQNLEPVKLIAQEPKQLRLIRLCLGREEGHCVVRNRAMRGQLFVNPLRVNQIGSHYQHPIDLTLKVLVRHDVNCDLGLASSHCEEQCTVTQVLQLVKSLLLIWKGLS